MKLVWKLLRQHISIPQFVGFFFANLVGVVIILLGVQFYNDYQALDNEDSFMKADYLIVNKKIGALSGLTGGQSTFSSDDIDELKAELDFVTFHAQFLTSSIRANLADRHSPVQEELLVDFLQKCPDFRDNPYVRRIPPKHKLLTWLLLHRMRLAVHVLMRLNNRAKNR